MLARLHLLLCVPFWVLLGLGLLLIVMAVAPVWIAYIVLAREPGDSSPAARHVPSPWARLHHGPAPTWDS
jgi:hypothetical protein